jgi:hypothetical protein
MSLVTLEATNNGALILTPFSITPPAILFPARRSPLLRYRAQCLLNTLHVLHILLFLQT